MMWTFNATMEKLEQQIDEEKEEDEKKKSNRENLLWKAYNQTLLENSKSFPSMIALNRSDAQQDFNATLKTIINYFNTKKINQTKVYYDFVNKFYSDFEHRTIKGGYSKFEKIYKKLRSEFYRFKLR